MEINIFTAIGHLRDADPQGRYTFSIDKHMWWSRHKGYELETTWTVMATAEGHQPSVHRVASLEKAVDEVVAQLSAPKACRAAAIRQQIAALEREAQALEGEGK